MAHPRGRLAAACLSCQSNIQLARMLQPSFKNDALKTLISGLTPRYCVRLETELAPIGAKQSLACDCKRGSSDHPMKPEVAPPSDESDTQGARTRQRISLKKWLRARA